MWNSLIINPMTNALLVLYDFLGGNFILAIAVFTLLIRLVTLPLNMRQQKTTLRMQEKQPQVQAIQKKYKDNPAKMQEEFRKIGYNPAESLTGCLPLLIQFPILIGLYRVIFIVLGSTPLSLFELTERVYPFVDDLVGLANTLPIENKFLWLNLAQPDPWFVLPILIFVTMFVQQRFLSPARKKNQSDDKKKQQDDNPMAGMTQSMQYTMPIMFGFFSLSFPSGLSVYWILSNIIGIAQGYFTRTSMQRESESAEVKEKIPPTTGIPKAVEKPKATKKPKGGQKKKTKKAKAQSKRKRQSAKK